MLRDANSDFIRASPRRMHDYTERTDEQGIARAAQTGPVFSIDPASGDLHMRYTARTRSIEWKQDATIWRLCDAEILLASDSPHIHHARLDSGMGLLCNNVLHDRAAFADDGTAPRLLFRVRHLTGLPTPLEIEGIKIPPS